MAGSIGDGNTGRRRIGRRLLAVGSILAGLVGLASPAVAGGKVEPRVAFDRPVLAAGGATTTVHLEIDFAVPPPDDGAGKPRPPLNLSLVLDRSGSMEEARKIDYLREAALIAVDRLTADDRIAVVDYDDRITVLWPSQPAREREGLRRLIRMLTPRGSTDLAGGLVAGIDQARPHVATDRVTRVILMTDGLANHGVTEPSQIRRIAREAKANGVRTATIGLGLDFNETLLQGIAETGGGTYYYVESPRQMARIFDRELEALTKTVAKDCVLRLRLSGPQIRSVTPLGVPSQKDGGDTVIDLEDFYAGEQRSLLVRVEVEPGTDVGALALGSVRLAYRDAASADRQEIEAPLAVEVSADSARAAAAVNGDVAAKAALARASDVQAQAIAQAEAGRTEEAGAMLSQLADDLKAQGATLKDKKLAAKAEALDIDRQRLADRSAGATQAMSKSGRSQIYQMARGKTGGLLLQKGDEGTEVAALVEALAKAGVFKGPVQARFDDQVEEAVRVYQKKESLPVDGVAGPGTLSRLGLY